MLKPSLGVDDETTMNTIQLLNKRHPTHIYQFKHIPSLGGNYAYGRDINQHGHIVGDSYLADNKTQHAFLYQDNQTTDIDDAIFDKQCMANAINAHGLVVGQFKSMKSQHNHYQAFAYDSQHKTVTTLGTLDGGSSSYANDVNDNGFVVGYGVTAENNNAALIGFADQQNSMRLIGTLGGNHSVASAINNAESVVGYSAVNELDTHAFIFHHGKMHSLGTLGGASSFAYDINETGKIVGSAYNAEGEDHAFLYDPDARPCMKDLGTLGGRVSVANGLNIHQQVVGYSFTTGDTDAHAFLYQHDQMIDLNDLLDKTTKDNGWVLNEALSINDQGDIVGIAYNEKFQVPSCAFLLRVNNKASHGYFKFLTQLGLKFGDE